MMNNQTVIGSQAVVAGRYDFKRVFDLWCAILILVILAPGFSLVALIIKWDSPGPVFFRQPRIGLNDEIFWIWKFRTMYHAAADLAGRRLTERNDPRITRNGTWLRALSLDELPQLYNVVSGDMSLVGPRPHPVHAQADGQLYSELVPDYGLRHSVRPGITGWAQVNGWRGETISAHQIEQRVRYDLDYIAKRSFTFDLAILLRTVSEAWKQDSF